jgi:hypothetical protein
MLLLSSEPAALSRVLVIRHLHPDMPVIDNALYAPKHAFLA